MNRKEGGLSAVLTYVAYSTVFDEVVENPRGAQLGGLTSAGQCLHEDKIF